jgi:hypothetical protein
MDLVWKNDVFVLKKWVVKESLLSNFRLSIFCIGFFNVYFSRIAGGKGDLIRLSSFEKGLFQSWFYMLYF